MLIHIIKENRIHFSITMAIIIFIWIQSVLNGDISSSESGSILNLINNLLHTDISHTLIRKIGHISEYTCLGVSLGLLTIKYTRRYAVQCAFSGLIVAFIDESIQVFTPDRGPLITDVWIDFGGILLGIVIATLISRYYIRHTKGHA